MKNLTMAVAALAMMSIATSASAQTKVAIGTLTCVGGEGVGLILGSKKTYDCKFSANASSRGDRYRAAVTKIGLDIGVTGKTTMVWTVLAATNSYKPGMLTGDYIGASADASVAVGGGAKVLVGGSGDSVVLQPVSVQGQAGVNLAVGVASMTLR